MPSRARTANKKKQPAAVETSESIAEQMEAFFAAGGKIEKIQTGVSGQTGSYYASSSQKAKSKTA